MQGTTNHDNGAGGNDTAIRVNTAAISSTTTWRGTGTKEREDDGIATIFVDIEGPAASDLRASLW